MRKLILCDRNEEMVKAWTAEFKNYPNVEIVFGNILNQKCDAIVSPANSFGFMNGGLDYQLSKFFGWGLQKRLQQKIKEKHNGMLLVGMAEIVETFHKDIPYLISAPTMMVPMTLENSINSYLATRAVFLAVESFNKNGEKIKTVAMPGMGTGVGQIPYSTAAKQMRAAYDEVILKKYKFPKNFAEAQRKYFNLIQ